MDTADEFWKTYEQLSSRLKKKYLKKAHFTDSLDHFTKLAKHLDDEKCPQYAAFCSLAVAKCEQTTGNHLNEAKAYKEAAEFFMRAHLESGELNYEEHLSAALQAFSAAIKIYSEHSQQALAAVLLLQVGHKLIWARKPEEAVIFFQRANEFNVGFPTAFMEGMNGLMTSLVLIKDFQEALNTVLNYMQYLSSKTDVTMEPCRQAFGRCKVHVVLLSVLTREANLKMTDSQQKLWDTFEGVHFSNPVGELPSHVFFTVQSILLAVNICDLTALHTAENSCLSFWNAIESNLLANIRDSLLNIN